MRESSGTRTTGSHHRHHRPSPAPGPPRGCRPMAQHPLQLLRRPAPANRSKAAPPPLSAVPPPTAQLSLKSYAQQRSSLNALRPPLTAQHSSLTTHRSPLTAHRSPLTAYRSPHIRLLPYVKSNALKSELPRCSQNQILVRSRSHSSHLHLAAA